MWHARGIQTGLYQVCGKPQEGDDERRRTSFPTIKSAEQATRDNGISREHRPGVLPAPSQTEVITPKLDFVPPIISTNLPNFVAPPIMPTNPLNPITPPIVSKTLVPSIHKQPGVSKRARRHKGYFRRRRNMRRLINESIISVGQDSRLYANVTIGDVPYTGLLDSGANCSILGKGCEVFLDHPTIKFHHLPSSVKTAGGTDQRILGYVLAPYKYGRKTGIHTFYLAPGLIQSLYLGIDFWSHIGLTSLITEELTETTTQVTTDEKTHKLSTDQRDTLEKVITLFPDSAVLGLGRTSILSHNITLTEEKPIKQRYYPVSPAIQKEIYAELDRMVSLGVIEESSSPWCSPMALVRKKNGKARLCLDARKINACTKKDAYPLPIIEGLLGRLETTYYISTLDLKDAYWQIPLEEASREVTAFTVQGRPLYQFKVMPFGLCNAAQTLCRLMHRVIPHQLHDRVFVYLDDLLITSASFEEHIELLRLVASRLSEAGLTINLEKSRFCLKEVEYLGHVVGGGSLRVNPDKVRAITEYPFPKTVRQVRRFLGMTGWYRRFISDYSQLSAGLTDLLRKGHRFGWSRSADQSFHALKEALASAPVLRHPDFKQPFFIQCDASKDGVGSVLFQRSEDGSEHPIAFYSHKLNKCQRNYSVTELECLAAVLSVKKFRPYIEGFEFTIITDHASLQWLMSQTDLSGRLARWSLKLQPYKFNITHCKGTNNKVPDALSRIYSVDEIVLSSIEKNPVDVSLHVDLSDPAFLSPCYLKLIETITANPSSSNLLVKEGKAFINITGETKFSDTDLPDWKLIVPFSLTTEILKQAHLPPNAAHQGMAKTLDLIKRYFYWKGMVRDVSKFVRECEVCKSCKAVNYTTQPLMGKIVESKKPFQRIYIDFLGPYPRTARQNSFIIIVVDHFSRFVLCKAIKQATSVEVIKFLSWIFNLFSVPEVLFSDNGKQFQSHQLREFLAKYGVRQEFTPHYSPQSNISERVNRSILAAIRSFIKEENHNKWDIHLEEICSALRNSTHESIKYSPHYLVFGQHYMGHGSNYQLVEKLELIEPNFLNVESKPERMSLAQSKVLRNLQDAYTKHQFRYNLRSRPRKFQVGQVVFVKNHVQSKAIDKFSAKLAPKFIKGIVTRQVGNVAYEVTDSHGKSLGVLHARDFR